MSATPPPAIPTRPRRSVTTVVVIVAASALGLLILLLIVAAVVVPNIESMHQQANETSAVLSLKSIQQAEMNYNLNYPAKGFSCSLPALGATHTDAPVDSDGAQLLDPRLAAMGAKAGYQFTIVNCVRQTIESQEAITAYEVTAVPTAPAKTGHKGFCMHEDGLIKVDPAGGTRCTEPLP